MSAAGETRYAKTSDGLHIAYQTHGTGLIDLLIVPGWATHVEHGRTEPSWLRYAQGLERFARVITLDKRGSGMSDRDLGVATLEDRMEDIHAVMDSVGSQTAVIFGASEGAPLSLLFAATYPERTKALVLYGPVVKWLASDDYPWGLPPMVYDMIVEVMEQSFGEGIPLGFFAPSVAADPGVKRWWAEHERLASSPGSMKAMLHVNRQIDVRPILSTVTVPTLIIHRVDDMVVNVGQGRYLAAALPHASYIELPGADHLPFYGDSDAIVEEVEEFLTGVRHTPERDRVLATVLFTDIVGSTERAAALGDQQWRDLLDQHHTIVRAQLARFKGREVNTTGDGFVATFDGPARALRCACAVRDAVENLGIAIRAGVHTGEIEVVGNDIAGIAVHIAQRVQGMASPGEVLASSTVRDLVAGSGIAFDERGEHDLKGVPGTWRLLLVTL